MITNRAIRGAWWKYIGIHSDQLIVSMVGFLTTGVIWAHIAKHVFHSKFKFWWLNDTPDGDYGPSWFMEGFPRGIITAFFWWLRNHSWNFYYTHIPEWKAGSVDRINGESQFRSIKRTITKETEYGRFTKASKADGIYGTNYFAYQINGRTYFNYSYANKYITIQLGAGGNEYRFWIKL